MTEAGLDPSNNRWDLIFDFTEYDESGNKLSNFHVIDPSEFSIVTKEVEGDETAPSSIPVPQKYGGSLPDNDPSQRQVHEGMSEFKIGTSIADAQKQYEAAQVDKNMEEEVKVDEEEQMDWMTSQPTEGHGDQNTDFGVFGHGGDMSGFGESSIDHNAPPSQISDANLFEAQPADDLDDEERELLRKVELEKQD